VKPVDIHNTCVRGFDSISPTGEKTITMVWSYYDPEEQKKVVRWLRGDGTQRSTKSK
jgi:hypothetical protein